MIMSYLVEAGLGAVSASGHLVFFGADKVAEDSQKLEVAGRGDVVVTVKFLLKTSREDSNGRVDFLAHRHLHRTHPTTFSITFGFLQGNSKSSINCKHKMEDNMNISQ